MLGCRKLPRPAPNGPDPVDRVSPFSHAFNQERDYLAGNPVGIDHINTQ